MASDEIVPEPAPEYPADKPPTPLLDTVNYPVHMKNLTKRVCFRPPLMRIRETDFSLRRFLFFSL